MIGKTYCRINQKQILQVIHFGLNILSQSISHPNNDLIIKESFTSLQDDYCWMHDTKLLTCNSISDNLMSIFVFNKAQFFTSRSFQTKTCRVINCETCQYVSNKSYFLLKNFFVLPIKTNSSCLSTNIVYIIECKLCNVFYVGQSSKSANTRIRQHLRAIKNFKPFIKYTSEVGYHFNLKGHSTKDHFRFSIFVSNLELDSLRFSVECDIINIFNSFHPPIINEKKPNIYNIKHLTFI